MVGVRTFDETDDDIDGGLTREELLSSSKATDFEEAITKTGYGRFNLFVILVCGGALMCVIIETQGVMFIVPSSSCDLDLSLSEKGLLSSISYLGVFVSSHLWGFLADTRGRRIVVLISLCMSFVSSAISSLSPVGWLFILLRFVNGFFIGGCSAIIYAYAGEFINNKHRPSVVAWITVSVAVGTLVLPSFAWLILPSKWSLNFGFVQFRPWRLLLIVYSLPTIIFAILIYLLPESPKFLLSQGKHDEALEILKTIYYYNTRSNEEFPMNKLVLNENNVVKSGKNVIHTMWEQTVPLFKKVFVLQTLMVCALHFGSFTITGLLMWYPQILKEVAGYVEENPGTHPTICRAVAYHLAKAENTTENGLPLCNDQIDSGVFLTSIIISIMFGVCFVSSGLFITKIGKKKLLAIFLVVGIVSSITAQLIPGEILIQIVLGTVLMSSVSVSIINAIIVDLYPTQIRAMALAIALMTGRIGAFTGSFTTGPLMYNFCNYFLYIFTVIYVGMIIVIVYLPSPTNHVKKTAIPI